MSLLSLFIFRNVISVKGKPDTFKNNIKIKKLNIDEIIFFLDTRELLFSQEFQEQLQNTPHLKLHGAASNSATRLRRQNYA